MTLENCAAFCAGYKYFGTEYAAECYCGASLHATAAEAASPADCAMPCTGNPAQLCGGPGRLELYEADGVAAAPQPSQPATVAGTAPATVWSFHGCVTEADGVRALGAASSAADTLTLEACAAACAGYQYFGAEFGRECYCGDGLAAGAVEVLAGECSMPCAGDGAQLCGAGNRLSVYAAGAA